jgi:hypothetical protein
MKFFGFLFCLFIVAAVFGQDDDEKGLNELNAEKEKLIKSYEKIHKTTEAIRKSPAQALEEMKKSGNRVITLDALMDPKMVEELRQTINLSKISEMPLDQMKGLIQAKVQGSRLEEIFKTSPKLLTMAAAIMIDKDALPALLGVLPQREQLKFFGLACLCIFFFGIVFKKIVRPKNAGFFMRVALSLGVTILVSSASLTTFYFLFENEVAPTVRVISRYL